MNANYDLFVLRSDRASDPVNLTQMPGQYLELGLSLDSARLAYLSDREDRWSWHLYMLDLHTGLSQRVTVDPIEGTLPFPGALSPDGMTIAAERGFWLPSTNQRYSEIYLVDAATGEMTDFTRRHETTVFHGSPAWSPDGSRLAVHRYRGTGGVVEESQILVIDADGADARVLVDDGSDPVWSPDGRQILFRRFDEGLGNEICVVDAGGGAVEYLSRDPSGDAGAAWSPDGRRIAFISTRSGKSDIILMDRRGGSQRNLTAELGVMMPAFQAPVWSPDGQYVVGVSLQIPSTRRDVYAIGVDGSEPINLTQHLQEGFTGWTLRVVP